MRGLYAILDVDALARAALDPLPFATAVLKARPAALQLRDKSRGARAMLALLEQLRPLCREHGVPLIANDRADLAALAACEGVHLGQSDLPARHARRVGEALGVNLRVGLSAHDEAEVDHALAAAPDYLALGPVFDTASKRAPEPTIGLDGFRRLAERAGGNIPLVAIGGIDVERARALSGLCQCVAVIGGLVPDSRSYDEVTARALAIQTALSRS